MAVKMWFIWVIWVVLNVVPHILKEHIASVYRLFCQECVANNQKAVVIPSSNHILFSLE